MAAGEMVSEYTSYLIWVRSKISAEVTVVGLMCDTCTSRALSGWPWLSGKCVTEHARRDHEPWCHNSLIALQIWPAGLGLHVSSVIVRQRNLPCWYIINYKQLFLPTEGQTQLSIGLNYPVHVHSGVGSSWSSLGWMAGWCVCGQHYNSLHTTENTFIVLF